MKQKQKLALVRFQAILRTKQSIGEQASLNNFIDYCVYICKNIFNGVQKHFWMKKKIN
jgi:hypothetical protein